MPGYPTRLAPSGTVPEGTTELWTDRKRYLWLIGLVVPSLAFVAFGGYTLVETLHGLGIVDLTGSTGFRLYTWLLVPFCVAVLAGIVLLAIRRGIVRPRARVLLRRYASSQSP